MLCFVEGVTASTEREHTCEAFIVETTEQQKFVV
jgi:hypothetical protein